MYMEVAVYLLELSLLLHLFQEALGHCRNLSVLYLYDNFLSRLEGLGTCPALTHLYLHDNHLSKIEGLGGLHRLTKL